MGHLSISPYSPLAVGYGTQLTHGNEMFENLHHITG